MADFFNRIGRFKPFATGSNRLKQTFDYHLFLNGNSSKEKREKNVKGELE